MGRQNAASMQRLTFSSLSLELLRVCRNLDIAPQANSHCKLYFFENVFELTETFASSEDDECHSHSRDEC